MVTHLFSHRKRKSPRGDSIIEVLIAVAIFSAIAVAALGIMNKGLENAQSSLETTIARTAMDTQAEKIRFIADSVTSDPATYADEWSDLVDDALDTSSGSDTTVYNNFINNYKIGQVADCNSISGLGIPNPFVITSNNGIVKVSNFSSSAIPDPTTGGLFVVAVKSPNGGDVPEYFDFYINTCWTEPGLKIPTKLSTTIRIQNPEYVTAEKPGDTPEDDPDELKITYHWFSGSNPHPDFTNQNYAKGWVQGDGDAISYSYRSLTTDSPATRTLERRNNGYLSIGSSSIQILDNNQRYNNYDFKGFTLNGDPDGDVINRLSYTCWDPQPSVAGNPLECEWDDSGSDTIEIYAHWKEIPKIPVWFYCIKYSSTNSGIASGYGASSVSGNVLPTCRKYYDNSGPHDVTTASNLGYSVGNNFTQYAWRTAAGQWNGYDPTNYQNATFVINGGTDYGVPVGTNDSITQYIKDDDQSHGTTTIASQIAANEELQAVYSITLFPQWRANIDIDGDSDDSCRNGSKSSCALHIVIRYDKHDSHTVTTKPKVVFQSFVRKDGTVLVKNQCTKTFFGVCTQDMYSNSSYGYIKIESKDDAEIAEGITYDSNHRIFKTDNWKYNDYDLTYELNIDPNNEADTLYLDVLSKNNQSGYKINYNNKTTETIRYRLRDGTTKNITLNPGNGNDKLCWRVLALKPSDGSLYIKNELTTDSTDNACSTNWVGGNTIPF